LDDFDKKLALFKKGLDGKKEKVKKSEEVVSVIYDQFISRFWDSLEILVLKFEDLFHRYDSSLDDYYKPQSNFFFYLEEFKKKPSKNIKIDVNVYWNIDSYQIDISLNSSTSIINITRDYDEIPKENEWKPIINQLGDKILKELEEALDK
jgi:hypothetical protein